ncbi:hypothetical protein ACHAXN_000282, partial [Cyclotella atomus]
QVVIHIRSIFDDWADFRKSCFAVVGPHYCGPLNNLRTLSTDAAGKLDILRHDSNTLGVDSAQVGVFEESNEVGFGGLLEGENRRSLEPQVTLEILGDLPDETLEGELADEQVGGLLVPTDLAKGHGSGTVPVGLLHASGGGGGLAGSLGGELLAGSFSSGGLAG